jgi:Zn finger protein HypA/HybF involved in hydrogenase expression
MTHCPHCQEEMQVPNGDQLRVSEFFSEEAGDIEISAQEHIQLECPNCEAVLGYLAVGAAAGG